MTTYTQHYEECRLNFNNPEANILSVTVEDDLRITSEYDAMISSLNRTTTEAFLDSSKYDEQKFMKQIKNSTQFPEVKLIHEYFYDQISTRFFGSHYTSNRIQIVRSIPTQVEPDASWVWHYDDNSAPHVKLFIYLSDVVSTDDAPFSYLSCPKRGIPKMPSSRVAPNQRTAQAYPGSRIPEELIKQENLVEKYVLGKKGKPFVFDPNIIHRATVPAPGHGRTALIYHYHPVSSKMEIFDYPDLDVKSYILR